jgi:arylsulfatase A-like enzyme
MNVLLISLDTTRADHLGVYGYPRATSPHLDRFAAESALFETCFSPWIPTHPAHTTMLTGQDCIRHQIIAQGGKAQLDAGIPTLAETLAGAGYHTAAADNLARWFNRGFHTYEGYSWAPDEKGAWRKGEAVTSTALRLLHQCLEQPRPFFLFVHYWDPHTPYLPPVPFDRMFYGGDERDPANRSMEGPMNFAPFMWYFRSWMAGVTDIQFPIAQYDASIAYMDLCLSHLLGALAQSGRGDETLVVITADHGEEMDEHQIWFDHHGLYDTNLHVPLIVRIPGEASARGRRVPGLVRLLDVTPTILDAVGLGEKVEALGMQGRSLLPLVRGRSRKGSCDTLYLTECTWMRKRGLRTQEWKLITALEPDIHGKPSIELFHLPTDPGEQRNLADERAEIVAELSAKLDRWVARRKRETGNPDPLEVQEITLRQIGKPPGG